MADDLIETMARGIGDGAFGWVDPVATPNTWDMALYYAKCALAAIEAAGYRVVPVETVDEARAALYGAREVLGNIANIQHAIDLLNAAAPKHGGPR